MRKAGTLEKVEPHSPQNRIKLHDVSSQSFTLKLRLEDAGNPRPP